MPNYGTVLALSGIGVAPYSARGLTQTLTPIAEAAQFARTINGILLDLAQSGFQKYASSINGNDHTPPAVDGVWPGRTIIVDCVSELCYAVGGTPSKVVVPGSSRTEEGFVFYRPRLTMMVMNFSVNKDEYQAQTGWQMDLEEI